MRKTGPKGPGAGHQSVSLPARKIELNALAKAIRKQRIYLPLKSGFVVNEVWPSTNLVPRVRRRDAILDGYVVSRTRNPQWMFRHR
jgi:hypothetical protein